MTVTIEIVIEEELDGMATSISCHVGKSEHTMAEGVMADVIIKTVDFITSPRRTPDATNTGEMQT